jgi:succinate dehydrogenase / fumarate reductase cytochrome b subunit
MFAPVRFRTYISHKRLFMAGAPSPDGRPISPHLSVWRWHVTMASSILHRVTGVGLYVAAIGFALWLMAAAAGPELYEPLMGLFLSPLGQIALYLIVAAIAFHLANGIRHLVFDTGVGLSPSDADTSAWFAIFFAFAAPIGLWALVTFGGA